MNQLAPLHKRTCGSCGQVFATKRQRREHFFAEHDDSTFASASEAAAEAIARRPDLQAIWLQDMNAADWEPERVMATNHLASLPSDHRAQLQREWKGEA